MSSRHSFNPNAGQVFRSGVGVALMLAMARCVDGGSQLESSESSGTEDASDDSSSDDTGSSDTGSTGETGDGESEASSTGDREDDAGTSDVGSTSTAGSTETTTGTTTSSGTDDSSTSAADEGVDEGSGDADGSSGTDGGGESSTGGADQTCAPDSELEPGDSNLTVDVGGQSRSYILHVPSSYSGDAPVPLVLDFHGLGGSGAQQRGSSGLEALSDREGFIIAWPDGIDSAWNVGPCCTTSRDVDDLGFASAIVDATAAAGCVDRTRVYATGFSMGGGMSYHLACNAADVFAAIAPNAFDLTEETSPQCAPSRPISVLSQRGTNDTVVPYGGGPGSGGNLTFLGAEGTLARWVELNGCTGDPVVDGSMTLYSECGAEGVQVGLSTSQGGGHAPGSAELTWDFLSSQTLP